MRFFTLILFFAFLFGVALLPARAATQLETCSYFFETHSIQTYEELISSNSTPIRRKELVEHVEKMIDRVTEFSSIRKLAQQLGIRVWLFGGTASSFLHYSKWDLASRKGLLDLQRERFDYEFSNIFRSSQDIDIVVDALPEVAIQFQEQIAQKFPHFLGNKKNQWEVRTLRYRMGTPSLPGYKEALLDDSDFSLQNTDSNSIGMIELTHSEAEPRIRDLRNWNEKKSIFLEDSLKNRISYFRSKQHFFTSRAKAGENPEILSVIRFLVKAFQFDLEFSSPNSSLNRKQMKEIKEIIEDFNPNTIKNPVAIRKIQETSKKLIFHSVNLESAIRHLDLLGIRKKLIALGDPHQYDSHSWWLNREPLKSRTLGQVPETEKSNYPTAQELGLSIVAHVTSHFEGYESINRAHSGRPNVLISRRNTPGETAIYGDGFYVRQGRIGHQISGLTVRFKVNPEARLGIDFHKTDVKDWFIFSNKNALKIIRESINFEWDDLVRIAESEEPIQLDPADLGLVEKFKRRFTPSKINEELELLWNSKNDEDLDRLARILASFQASNISKLFLRETLLSVFKNFYSKIADIHLNQSEREIRKYVRVVGPLARGLDIWGILQRGKFVYKLKELLKISNLSFDLRKQIAFEILINSVQFEKHLDFIKNFNSDELKLILKEIETWKLSPESRKRAFYVQLNDRWNNAVISGEIEGILKPFIEIGFFSIQHKNQSQLSMLQVASYYDQREILNWLIDSPEFNFNHKDTLGYTEVEQLRLYGKTYWADEIQKRRPEAYSRPIFLKERDENQITDEYPHGSPIIDFVKIEPGTFYMGGDQKKIVTTLTQSFEMMSVDVMQKMYRELRILIQKHLGSDYKNLENSDSYYYSGDSKPAYGISFDQITLWIKGINQLSLIDESEIQIVLKEWLPRHKKGDQYRLPTEAEWEMVTRLGGLAGGDFAHAKNNYQISEYAVFSGLSNELLPVGSRLPVFYRGKPLYDIHGLIWKWVSDWYADERKGGVDPQGPTTGVSKVIRGGSFSSSVFGIDSYARFYGPPALQKLLAGFRLVRVLE